MKASPEPSWERDIAFWTIPDTERKLLYDLWGPGNGDVSGLAFIYSHGGAGSRGIKMIAQDLSFGTWQHRDIP